MIKINFKKLRFYRGEHFYTIKAKRKSTGKLEVIGSCHLQSKEEILKGNTELIKFNFQLQTL